MLCRGGITLSAKWDWQEGQLTVTLGSQSVQTILLELPTAVREVVLSNELGVFPIMGEGGRTVRIELPEKAVMTRTFHVESVYENRSAQ